MSSPAKKLLISRTTLVAETIRAVYVGPSPDTGTPMYAMPADAPVRMTLNEAAEYAKTVNSQNNYGNDDWRVPTKNELTLLFHNRIAIGGFDLTGYHPSGWYWASSPYLKRGAWGQRFSDGFQSNSYKGFRLSVRLIRSGLP